MQYRNCGENALVASCSMNSQNMAAVSKLTRGSEGGYTPQ